VRQLTDRGIELVSVSITTPSIAFFGVMGKLIYGALVDRWDARWALWLATASQVAGQLFMLFGDGYSGFLIGDSLFGFASLALFQCRVRWLAPRLIVKVLPGSLVPCAHP
jgi:predicted MFS family arabinose efflux permease